LSQGRYKISSKFTHNLTDNQTNKQTETKHDEGNYKNNYFLKTKIQKTTENISASYIKSQIRRVTDDVYPKNWNDLGQREVPQLVQVDLRD